MKNYDPTKEGKYIMYLDANNLYGWTISQNFPYHKFKQLKNIDNFYLNSISENGSTGYILEVELKYPNELCELRNDYPLAPAKLEISYDMLSNYCEQIPDKYGIKVRDVKKLVPNLGYKSNYVVKK